MGWESKEANFTDNDWWEERRFGTETLSDRRVWMTPYSPWWRPASDAPLTYRRRDTARQGCPVHLEGGTWSSTNPSTQTLRFKRRFRYTVGAATYIYTYTEGIANDGSTTLSGPELSVVASTNGRCDHHATMQQPLHGCWRSGRDSWRTTNYGRKEQSEQIQQLQQQLQQLQQQGHRQQQSWAWSDWSACSWSSARWQQQAGSSSSGLGERPSEARDQETDAQIRELMSLSGIGWPMSDADEHEEQQQQQRGTGRWWTDSWWWTGSRWGSYSE